MYRNLLKKINRKEFIRYEMLVLIPCWHLHQEEMRKYKNIYCRMDLFRCAGARR